MILLIKPLVIQLFFCGSSAIVNRAYDETYMLSRVECVQLCPIIELYGIPPATASHFKWISIKRLTFLLLIPAMIRSEVKPSGKIKTNKSESDTSTKLRELNQLTALFRKKNHCLRRNN